MAPVYTQRFIGNSVFCFLLFSADFRPNLAPKPLAISAQASSYSGSRSDRPQHLMVKRCGRP